MRRLLEGPDVNSTAEPLIGRARSALCGADRWLSQGGLYGWDPYDGLSSPLAALASSRRPRQLFIQGVKRTGTRGRHIFRVPQHRMTKTLALVSAGLRNAP